jgi:hypothetical protein
MTSPGAALRSATLERLELLGGRVSTAIEGMRSVDPSLDALRGLYISDEQAEELVASGPAGPIGAGRLGPLSSELERWAASVGIDDGDVDLLLTAVAPDLDRRFEQIYGYLNDDVTLRRATVGLALRLNGDDVTDPAARRRLTVDGPLLALGLVVLEQDDRPFLTRSLRVPDRVVMALLGDDRPAANVTVERVAVIQNEWVDRLKKMAVAGVDLVHVVDCPDSTAVSLSSSALVESTGAAVVAHLHEGLRDWVAVLGDATREASLRSCGLVIDSLDTLIATDPRLIDRLALLPRPVVLVGRRPWEPDWSSAVPLSLDAPSLGALERDDAWRKALNGRSSSIEIQGATVAFRLGPDRIRRAANAAVLAADYAETDVSADHLQWGARQQNASGLRRLARRIEPSSDWSDLILNNDVLSSVREVAGRVRHRSFVLDDWNLRRGGGRGEGITALFSGPSGTGKTLAAEVIAHELGVDLHTVDLATVVDKYIGETEKNLDKIFNEAEQVNTVLFFDEADALFGKRSEVKDARDRYANVEVAYLLQRMERFDGLVVLATNLRLNIDDAFARRLDVTVDFPKPDVGERLRLWIHLIGGQLPLDETVDVSFLAESFELSGGHIRNAVVTAAYFAADADRDVGMVDLIRSVGREYRKLGRLCLESEFGDWYSVIAPSTEDHLERVR